MTASVENGEAERLAALRSYGILDSAPQPGFDRIVQMTARIFDLPTSLISLIDEDRQWFKASVGFDLDETSREHSLCSHTISQNGVLVVPDAAADPRFADNPYVHGKGGIRFYAGAPIVNPEGFKLGSLCIIAGKPRHDFSLRDQLILRDLATTIAEQIELHFAASRTKAAMDAEASGRDRAEADHVFGVLLKDVPLNVAMLDRSHAYVLASRRWCKTFGIEESGLKGRYMHDVHPHLPVEWREQHEACLSGGRFFVEEEELKLPGRAPHWFRRTVHPWYDRNGNLGGIIIVMVSLDAQVRARKELQESQHFIEAMLQNVSEGIIACDEHGALSIANRASAAILGIDPEKPRPLRSWHEGLTVYRAGEPTPIAAEDMALSRLMRGAEIDAEEYQIINHAGQHREVVVHGAAMREQNGDVIGAVVSLRDVTRERIIHRRWREADMLYKAIFNAATQYSCVLDVDLKVVEVNDRVIELLNCTREQLLGLPFWDKTFWGEPHAGRPLLMESLRMARAGQCVRYEVDYQMPDGSISPSDFSLTPVFDQTGAVTHIITEGRDISEQRDTQEALRRQTAELELMFNHVPIRIFYKDDKNRVLRLNKPAADSIGLSVFEAEGADTGWLFTEHADTYYRQDMEVINSGQPKLGIVEPVVPRNGVPGWVRTDKVPYTDPATGERFLFVASVDITAEQAAVEALRESEERYRVFYNQTPVMLESVDPDGRIISVSDYWLEKLGFSRAEVIGRPAQDFVQGGEHIRLPWETRAQVVKDLEIDLAASNGNVVTVLLSAVAQNDEDGNLVSWLTSLTDITDRKRIEAKLFQASKMESVGQLTGGLAHDFNNLLCIVLGNLQLIERRIGKEEHLAPLLNSAIQAVRSGSDLTQRLLGVSRGAPIETTEVDVPVLVAGLEELLQRALGSRFEVQVQLESDHAIARTDKAQLEAALLNLAINARDAMIGQGKLTVTVSAIQHIADEPELTPGPYIVLSVADTGVGIPADVLPKVLEPFFTTKARGKGSGLGLAMIYGLMRQLNGTVRIHSVVDEGTKVSLFLPAIEIPARSTTGSGTLQAPAIFDIRDYTIFVAEDLDEVRDVIVSILKESGCRTLTAANGPDAFKMLEDGAQADVLLTDISMPGAYNGVGLARRAKELRPHMPILFATGYAEDAVLEAARMFSDHPILQKPLQAEGLRDAIGRALGSAAARRRGFSTRAPASAGSPVTIDAT
ncbi:PAS domain S-box protein [Acuticoccus sp. MNP-M23]|uniref:PAS domain S-box protein n=1 Tax=Acuticoccus sp. MNP-M23 TaxID=3072793 RepID=UPI0028153427|nr:PAS domain S-box protein [Acuticoccus sp. MNP-M23]WMS40755.1 PAS domain S-box protein [Acuticoccus sp. MNP-M23]